MADHRRKLDVARAHGDKLIELAELSALEQRGALDAAATRRLSELLRERGRDWVALRRPIPLVTDLRHIAALEPARARALNGPLRNAARAAGDVWLSLGENARAEEEYRSADRLGAPGMLYRMRAAWGASPADLERDVLERALAELPERVLAPFATAYLDTGGDQALLLQRAWRAARVYGPPELATRLQTLPAVSTAPTPTEPDTGARPISAVTLVEPEQNDRLCRGPTLARVLLPLVDAFPTLIESGPRAREWAEWLLAEDSTGPDSLELAALIDARAGRTDGAARKLMDLVFYSPDRAQGHARAARVWERVNEGRRACLAWERAARLGAVDDPRWCNLVACLRANPGAGDAASVSRFVRERSPALMCEGQQKIPSLTGAGDAGSDATLSAPDAGVPPTEGAAAAFQVPPSKK